MLRHGSGQEEKISESENVESDVYLSMLEGYIGCRPDMKSEFKELADRHKGEKNEVFGSCVGVLACGPIVMRDNVTDAINTNGPLKTFSDAGKIKHEDRTETLFSYIEEEYER